MERRAKHQQFLQNRAGRLNLEIPTNITSHRPLHIYTWGIHARAVCPVAVEKQYNAEKLTGNRDHQHVEPRSLMQQDKFRAFAHAIVDDIETHDLARIAIYCCKGQCRSVAVADYLGQLYPSAQVQHLEK